MAKKLTKFEIASMIEALPGNTPWSSSSLMTITYDVFSRSELVDKYNNLVSSRGLHLDLIS